MSKAAKDIAEKKRQKHVRGHTFVYSPQMKEERMGKN